MRLAIPQSGHPWSVGHRHDGQRIAIVSRLQSCKFLTVFTEELGNLLQVVGAVIRRKRGPGGECLLGRDDRGDRVVGAALGDSRPHLAGRGVDRVHQRARRSAADFTTDQILKFGKTRHLAPYLSVRSSVACITQTRVGCSARGILREDGHHPSVDEHVAAGHE